MPTFSDQYIEPGVYVETQLMPVPTIGTAGPFITCLVGTVDPYTNVTTNLTRSSTGSVDTLIYEGAPVSYTSIDWTRNVVVQDSQGSGRTYISSPIDFPVPVANVTSGGTLTEGTYYYTVVAIKDDGNYAENPAFTESPQFAVSIPPGTTDGRVQVTFQAIPNATKYRLYGRTKGATGYIEVNAPTTTIVDDGSTLTSGTLPAINAEYYVKNNGGIAQIVWTSSQRRVPLIPQNTYSVQFYKLKQESEYVPKFYYAEQEQDAYTYLGSVEWDPVENAPKYSLPLGFRLAIANGASGVWCVPRQPNDSINDLLNKIRNLNNPVPYTLVFLQGYIQGSTDPNLTDAEATSIVSHVMTMSSVTEQRERIAIFGPPRDAYSDNNIVTRYTDTISLLKNRRIVYLYPSNISVQIGTSIYTVGGFYLGAALAGLIDSLSLDSSLSGRVLAGIVRVFDEQIRTIKNQIASKGTLIIENGRIRHALTTDMSTVLTRELKTTRIVDYITRLVRDSLRNFTNVTASGSVLSSIGATIKLLLSQMVNANILEDYRDITVQKNPIEANQIDVSYVFRPARDINWIYVKQVVQS